MTSINRREFIASTASFCLAGCTGLAANSKDTYSVVLVGDTHFDSTDPLYYHREYVKDPTQRHFKLQRGEHLRNAEAWRERMPRLLAAANKCRRQDAAFVLQTGDLVQGDCADGDLHRQMLEDGFRTVKQPFADLPFVTVCGNHDIRGKGARAAYDRYMPGAISRELGVPVERTTFSFRQGPDVFIVADFNISRSKGVGEDYGRILKLLDESRDARHTFLVTHGPFIAWTRWSLLGSPRRDAERRELTHLLAARNAIVIAGHTHVMELDECQYQEGRIAQVVINSIWTPNCPGTLVLKHNRPEQFSGNPRGLSPEKRLQFEAFISERKQFLKRYWLSRAAGFAQLTVSDAGVSVDFHACDSLAAERSERLLA